VAQISYVGRKGRDLGAITGAKPMTVAAFYVLMAPLVAQDAFWAHQSNLLAGAEEAGPLHLSLRGDIKPLSVENCAHTWIGQSQDNKRLPYLLQSLTNACNWQ